MTTDGGALVGNILYEDFGGVANWASSAEISRTSGGGSVHWQGRCCYYLGAGYEDFHVFETKSGDLTFAGTLEYFADNEFRNGVLIFRLDRDGKRRWEKLYTTDGQDAIDFIHELSNGDLLFAGQIGGVRTGDQDMWVLKTNAQVEISNCSHSVDGWGGIMVGFPEVETTTLDDEQKPFSDAGAQVIPLCTAQPSP